MLPSLPPAITRTFRAQVRCGTECVTSIQLTTTNPVKQELSIVLYVDNGMVGFITPTPGMHLID